MKYTVALTSAACIASASAFAPSTGARSSTQLAAKEEGEKKTLFKTIFDMDLFAPVKTQNDYGARNSKKVRRH